MVVGSRHRPAGQRHADREQQEPGGEAGLHAPKRPAARRLQAERHEPERQEIEEVALLHERGVAPHGRLDHEGAAEEGRQPAERGLGTAARSHGAQPDPDRRAGHDRPAARVEEDREVPADRRHVEVEMARPRVVAEPSQGDRDREAGDGEGADREGKPLLAQHTPEVALAKPDRNRGECEAERQHGELQPSKGCKRRAPEKEPLGARPRPLQRRDSEGDRSKCERIGDRLREDEAGVQRVRHE